ncbi:ATPase, T2SS/T4P/T4SS family [Tateyamaria sp.]|uniref:ATPase, T2SS/T4P/T4SS family n=1 Tax=Tateyamaria sp. TaxID=1929288 RepID=UPI003B224FFF
MWGDAAFRRVCAISKDGVYYFVPDRNDADLSAEVQRLQAAWDMPLCVERRAATLSGIAALNGALADHATDGPPTPGALRMAEVIAEATRLRASDLKLIIRGTDAVLRMKLGSEEFTHGPAWQVREAEEALSWLFDERDKGDGASAEQSGQHQSFSVGHRQRIALPEGLVALRGQKAPHGDGHDFVVLRLITAGDATAAGRIEDLGLDEDVLEALARERHSDTGLVIIGGSTGDGKSTTLVRQLERLYQERKGRVSIMTVEDPIEYPIIGDGIVQMPVPGAAEGAARGAAFTRALRTFVRSNPDFGNGVGNPHRR